MSKKPNFIELNGKRYDARTGSLLVEAKHAAPQPAAIVPHPVATHTPPVMDVRRPAGSHLKHRQPTRSQTLMRSVVRKPEPSARHRAKVTSHTHSLVQQPKVEIVKKLSHPKVDAAREHRAKLIKQSGLVRRFAFADITPKPLSAAIHPSKLKPAADTPAIHAVQAPISTVSSIDVFERALQRANSHLEKPVHPAKRKHRSHLGKRAIGVSASVLAFVLLTGFIAYQNQANLTVRYASSKAGFTASLPGYRPAGFKAGKVTYSPGLVGVKFSNNVDGQSFSLVQKQSNWNSGALLDNFVASRGNNYKTIESAGRTIYTYGDNDATWVNGGVWYQVKTGGSLTTNDLVNLATSM